MRRRWPTTNRPSTRSTARARGSVRAATQTALAELDGRRGRNGEQGPPRAEPPARLRPGRIVAYALGAVAAWLLISLIVFLVSAGIQSGKVSDEAKAALTDGGFTLTSANTVLILGSDARTRDTAEPGSSVGGQSRSDSILLLRIGGGANAQLSIPRDTVVDIPGSGTNKINAAYAIGGARALDRARWRPTSTRRSTTSSRSASRTSRG